MSYSIYAPRLHSMNEYTHRPSSICVHKSFSDGHVDALRHGEADPLYDGIDVLSRHIHIVQLSKIQLLFLLIPDTGRVILFLQQFILSTVSALRWFPTPEPG